ncbi:unnamed protein product [Mycena citricolor]|uniref:Uncharacterized protein n=1 Tax=Mycena citricolor TaxID=2018698 RepID=A0AAD2H9A0_9AGAR|nr:unnamed protein product [Mycena citricolor]
MVTWAQHVAPWMAASGRRRPVLFVILVGIVVIFLLLTPPKTEAVLPTPAPISAEAASTIVQSEPDRVVLPADDATPSGPVLKLPGPPTYASLRKWEDNLPQHDLDLPYPEGKSGRYVKFSNEMKLVGWNNCLNERLMNAHLAYISGRAYVFSDYMWAWEHYAWPHEQHPPGGPRTPLNAIVSGPMAGGPWASDDPAPRSISAKWFDVVCPLSERRLLNTTEVKPFVLSKPGIEVLDRWAQVLRDAPERCIEVIAPPEDVDDKPQVFDLWLWGNSRVLSLWDPFSKSPTSRLLGPSPLVQSAIDRNLYLFLPHGPQHGHPHYPSPSYGPRDPFDRMLAVHIRRGDYVNHCENLANWGSTYYSWALLPSLVDHFIPPPAGDPNRVDKVLKHCLPSLEQFLQRIHDVREEYLASPKKLRGESRVLDVLYLLTNEHGPWIEELEAAVKNVGWNTVVSTRDLTLDVEQEDVSMAIDMQIARRAAVFLGNGWSSFTSNIIHQRLVDNREPLSTRLT